MEKEIILVLKYFHFFDYPVTFDEIYNFLSKKVKKEELKKTLQLLVKQKKIFYLKKIARYTLGEYSIDQSIQRESQIKKRLLRQSISQKKLKTLNLYLKILSWFPQILLVGLSGSLAMFNAQEKDDIDLFIITQTNRLWTGRLICILIAKLLGRKRERNMIIAPNKICLNLFFEANYLTVPLKKQNLYIAHELVQMKPLIDKNNSFKLLLKANRWIYNFFPNLPLIDLTYQKDPVFSNFLADWFENVAKFFQLIFIKRHRTKEKIDRHQLWFFPEDFEKKLSDII
jgi:hypothetical protein